MPWFWRPSRLDPDRPLQIPERDLDRLLASIGVMERLVWKQAWLDRGIVQVGQELWAPGTSADWLWCLALPLLTLAEQRRGTSRSLIGLSALPGCGKTTLGAWLEVAAEAIGLSFQVVSIDDFYLPSPALDQSMAGNPWGVPRAIPGSHELQLMATALDAWKSGQSVQFPCFDKALRDGRGDRSGWRNCDASVLLLEGWFVGCEPLAEAHALDSGADHLEPSLQDGELRYRSAVQSALEAYQPIWSMLDHLWQIKAPNLNAPSLWKRQQNESQQRLRGSGLPDDELRSFIRMVSSAIPSLSFELPRADVVFTADAQRNLSGLSLRT
jgi:D-glycerate 3-kinase